MPSIPSITSIAQGRDFQVSVILPFADDEDRIGSACRRIATHLRTLGLAFEIIAVDEDSRDNCSMVLGLLRDELPELRVITARPGRGYVAGVRTARGRVLWLLDAGGATTLSPFARAHRRIAAGEVDAVVVDGRFTICHRTHSLKVFDTMRGSYRFHLRFARRAQGRGLAVEEHASLSAPRRTRSWQRLIEALSPAWGAGIARFW